MERMTPAPVKPPVTVDAFEALDLRAGTIVAVDDVEGSSKLVRLTIDLGDHRRTILAGMKKERADLGGLVGIQTLVLVNLEPRRMAGVVSEGMLVDIGYADGLVPVLATPERPVPNGTRAG